MKKRKWISLFVICLTLSVAGYGQIAVGVKAGVNAFDNYQTGTKYYFSSPAFGFHAGAYGRYAINERLNAGVDVLLSTRGINLSEYTLNGGAVHNERQSLYIDIPTYASYTVWKKYSLDLGIVSSLFLNEYRSITTNEHGFKIEDDDQFRSYERWQFGLMAGAQYSFSLFDQNFSAGLRYNIAITPAFELIRDARASRDPKYLMAHVFIACKFLEFSAKSSR
jgi:hypothetical protein